ncbi:histidine phosphatase family protein [Endozoicomonas arenosclerae]|uniref:histidine phosphatase family protein n=1 Tax=Endozoicomonas arenosclerae TaxID=1633495 RepID=UPI00155F642F|nr:histidine phosphatase family protein [Endozoicomonas arenosclerae]
MSATTAWFFLQPAPTVSLASDEKRLFDLETHWDQGNVVALVRHAERCDRSDNQCMQGETGITVPGKKEAIEVGQEFSHLPNQETIVYNSPVKRTDQTADLMFGEEGSTTQVWLREGCKENLYADIFKYKEEGKNLILVTHSTCIDKLGEAQNNDLVVMDIHDKSTYNSSIFLTIDQDEKEAYTLGYLYADDWDKAFN